MALKRWAEQHQEDYNPDGTPKEPVTRIMADAVNGMVDKLKNDRS